jgi:protein-disulfide isomerase
MLRIRILVAALAMLGGAGILSAFQAPAPKIDKPKFEAYLRYAESFTSGVKMAIDDPTPSPYTGYFRIVVHLTMGPQQAERVYYVSSDGERVVNGAIWNLNETPFLDTLQHLSTDGPSFGPVNAKVSIVVFSDFECPYCREFAKTMRDNIPQKYPNDVRVVFKNFPIEAIHKWARAAAEAGSCLASQKPSAFWAFHDWIFEHQQEANDTFEHQRETFDKYLKDRALLIAKEQNVDAAKVASCMETHASAQDVEKDLEEGRLLQVQQTPTLFVNGRTVAGAVPWATLDTIIQLELNRPKDIAEPPAAMKCCEINVPTIVKK